MLDSFFPVSRFVTDQPDYFQLGKKEASENLVILNNQDCFWLRPL